MKTKQTISVKNYVSKNGPLSGVKISHEMSKHIPQYLLCRKPVKNVSCCPLSSPISTYHAKHTSKPGKKPLDTKYLTRHFQ